MTPEARTTEGKNLRVSRAGPWDDLGSETVTITGEAQGRARQGNVWYDAMHYSAM